MDFVHPRGVEVAYQHTPARRCPLCSRTGAADDSRARQPQLTVVSDEFTGGACDEPGARGRRPDRVSLADYADAFAAVTDDVRLARAQVCGLSLGRPGGARAL
jgi:hypothetical protein